MLEEMQSSKVYFWNVTFQRYYGTKSMKLVSTFNARKYLGI